MKFYSIIKMFVLAFMLGVYILFLIMIVAAWMNGGWVVVLVDKYREGLAELVLLASALPLASYVTFREYSNSISRGREEANPVARAEI